MAFNWSAGWVRNSAIPILYDESGKPLLPAKDRALYGEDLIHQNRHDCIVPDLMKCAGELSLSAKAASIVRRWEPGIDFVQRTLHWEDGSLAEYRYAIKKCDDLLPDDALDLEWSQYVRSRSAARLGRIDDRFVIDRDKVGNRHIWSSRGMSNPNSYFATEGVIADMKEEGITGLFLIRYPERQGRRFSGPIYDPASHVFLMTKEDGWVREGPLDGDLNAVAAAGELPDTFKWKATSGSVMMLGLPVLSTHVPTRWHFGSRDHRLGGFRGSSGCLNVSSAFREIIETFEPGRHQFFPVDFVNRADELVERRHIMVICNLVDSLDPTRSDPGNSKFWRLSGVPGYYQRRLYIDPDKVGDRHIWLDHWASHGNTCFVSYDWRGPCLQRIRRSCTSIDILSPPPDRITRPLDQSGQSKTDIGWAALPGETQLR